MPARPRRQEAPPVSSDALETQGRATTAELNVKGVTVPYRTVGGEVLEVRLLSETHVSGHGGGGGSDQFGNVSINPINVSSQVRNRAHAVVQWDTGFESTIETDAGFTMRAGHQIVAIDVSYDGQSGRGYVFNRNTGQFWIEPLMEAKRKRGIVAIPLILGFAASAMTFVSAAGATYTRNASSDPMMTLLMAAALPIIGIVVARSNSRKQKRRNATIKEINAAFRGLAPRF